MFQATFPVCFWGFWMLPSQTTGPTRQTQPGDVCVCHPWITWGASPKMVVRCGGSIEAWEVLGVITCHAGWFFFPRYPVDLWGWIGGESAFIPDGFSKKFWGGWKICLKGPGSWEFVGFFVGLKKWNFHTSSELIEKEGKMYKNGRQYEVQDSKEFTISGFRILVKLSWPVSDQKTLKR